MEHTTHDTEKEKDIAALREEVRKAIQAAVPDITEHREECLCRIHGNCPFKSHDKVGRPITLPDVLIAVGFSGNTLHFKLLGNQMRLSNDKGLEWWDLEKGYYGQDDYCIRFLASILL